MDKESEPLAHDPTPILTLPPDDPVEELTEDELALKKKKEKGQMCKTIALHDMGLHPIKTNVSALRKSVKAELLEKVQELFEKPDEDIMLMFNKVVCDVVLGDQDDYTQYPVYK